jgi:hypothetical protein
MAGEDHFVGIEIDNHRTARRNLRLYDRGNISQFTAGDGLAQRELSGEN